MNEDNFGFKLLLIIPAVIMFSLGMDWIVQGNNFFLYKFFAPRQEDVRREVYTHTRSYRQGSIQRLNTLCTQLSVADTDHQPMIRDVISQEFADWDVADVPAYLHSCFDSARH